jgi:hypothetical protein
MGCKAGMAIEKSLGVFLMRELAVGIVRTMKMGLEFPIPKIFAFVDVTKQGKVF